MTECSPSRHTMFDELAQAGKALSNGKRLELLDLLGQVERTVDALARAAGLGVTTTSAHLQTLKHAGLVATRKDGTRVYYRLAGPSVARLYTTLRDVAIEHRAATASAVTAYLGPDVEEVTRDELLGRLAAGAVTLLDVRPPEEFNAGHIPGAVNIPLEELVGRLTELPDDRTVIAYCRGAHCALAPRAVRLLSEHGRLAARLNDGMLEWRLDHQPIELASSAA